MKQGWKIAICLAGGLAFNASIRAGDVATPDSPYSLIVARNIFNLLPPPPPPDPNPPPAAPNVKITPTGIMSVMGVAQVLYKTTGGAKPGEQSYMLSEGQGEDEIEVVKIDQINSIITFKNHGVVQSLPLSSASDSPAAGQPAPLAVAFKPTPTPAFPVTLPVPAANGTTIGGTANNTTTHSAVSGGAAGQDSGPTVQFGAATQTHSTTQSQQPAIDPDVQKVMIVANHLKAIQDGAPEAVIYPPTDLDAEAGVPSNQAADPADTNATTTPDSPAQ